MPLFAVPISHKPQFYLHMSTIICSISIVKPLIRQLSYLGGLRAPSCRGCSRATFETTPEGPRVPGSLPAEATSLLRGRWGFSDRDGKAFGGLQQSIFIRRYIAVIIHIYIQLYDIYIYRYIYKWIGTKKNVPLALNGFTWFTVTGHIHAQKSSKRVQNLSHNTIQTEYNNNA